MKFASREKKNKDSSPVLLATYKGDLEQNVTKMCKSLEYRTTRNRGLQEKEKKTEELNKNYKTINRDWPSSYSHSMLVMIFFVPLKLIVT